MDSSYLTLSLLNAFLSYTSTMLNIVTIHAIRKTPSLSKNLKALLLSQAFSDLGVGLLAQPMYVARLIMESKLNSGTNSSYNAIYIAYLVPTNLFTLATLFLIVVLWLRDLFVRATPHEPNSSAAATKSIAQRSNG